MRLDFFLMLVWDFASVRPINYEEQIMTRFFQYFGLIMIVGLVSFLFTSVAYGGNECRIKYGWNKGNTIAGTFKNKSKKIYLNKGQTKTINKKRMNYVKNLKSRNVKFYLKNAQNVTLGKDQSNPVAGTYVGKVKLKKVKCLGDTSSSSSSNNSASSSSSSKCADVAFPDVSLTPSPAGPIPIPYPNISKEKCKP